MPIERKVIEAEKIEAQRAICAEIFERVTAHFGSFCDAIRTGKKASTDFDYGAPLADLTALVNVAQRAGCKKLLWDGNRFTNDAKANSFIAMNYRPGWSIA